MAKKLYEESHIADIAAAIREKGGTGTYKVAQMADAVRAISGSASVEGVDPLVTYDQQNPLLTQYLTESAGYTPDDYTVSVALSYAYKKPAYIKCHPVGYTVSLDNAGELNLTDGGEVLTKTVEAGDHVLINTTPNKVAHWWLTVGGSVKQCGTIKPTGAIRMIATPAINVRDLGGWACDGGTVKYGKIFRGGELSASDREVLVGQLGIRHDIDLRSKDETGGITKSPLGDEVYYTNPDNYPWYTLVYNEWGTLLRTIFNAVAHNEPLIFHCAAGSDRTGTVACIVEALLGMSQTDIDRDFELSTFGISLGEGVYEARRRTDRHTNDDPTLRWRDLIEEITAKDGDTFNQKVVNWVGNTLKFTADEINAFRHSMIDGNPADVVVEEPKDYTRVEWVQIAERGTTGDMSMECYRPHLKTNVRWCDVGQIKFRLACYHTANTKDIIFCTMDGSSYLGTSPYIRTDNTNKMFGQWSGSGSYSITPSIAANGDFNEFEITMNTTATGYIRIGSWGDGNYTFIHYWDYVEFLDKSGNTIARYEATVYKYGETGQVNGFMETVSGEFVLDNYTGGGFPNCGEPL